jgi:hypothetical protein
LTYDVQFSIEAAAELVRIASSLGSAISVLKATENIRSKLQNEPAAIGVFLSEGLYYIDELPACVLLDRCRINGH